MPPLPKFTKNEIAQAGLNIIRKKGPEALTAKELGKELGSSARPIFTTFLNMEEVWDETIKAARTLYNQYVAKGFQEGRRFFGIGMQLFHFAKEESRLFSLLFMRSGISAEISDIVAVSYDNYEEILSYVAEKHRLSREASAGIFQTMFIFTYGIACLHVTGALQFTEDEVAERIRTLFLDVLRGVKGKLTDADLV
jgi:AcrR family transcriptional regulator